MGGPSVSQCPEAAASASYVACNHTEHIHTTRREHRKAHRKRFGDRVNCENGRGVEHEQHNGLQRRQVEHLYAIRILRCRCKPVVVVTAAAKQLLAHIAPQLHSPSSMHQGQLVRRMDLLSRKIRLEDAERVCSETPTWVPPPPGCAPSARAHVPTYRPIHEGAVPRSAGMLAKRGL
jgi:hypothetical protein